MKRDGRLQAMGEVSWKGIREGGKISFSVMNQLHR